ncbi:TIGR03885 family FMN-dependent LLM class oxidoreductase [Vallicoccus soli]|uniref:TIGR03557 family F420-dependent LLM class oxidoreductase n=1 Tax=Vallicoccus soli TaxID=2339232 RepID=A0A3A3Z0K7_9ACTN|nr:TIGR03885 family FMN-dependent LLM class oxidoreductase [Vallicoccus soli]RJK96041.1 TIGR03557 family F420-dependent LLM class oxidoreductase [Vallicoccus soli]
MTRFGFHSSHEQIPPGRLLEAVQAAERAGFGAAMCSDHFAPWSSVQGESGYAWSWLGAALATTDLRFGVVTAPGQRYHPAVHAQKMATLASMFPGRFWAALGSGQNLNEHVTGGPWPTKQQREERLLACVEVFRALFAGEEVSVDGPVRVDRARLWTLPAEPPPLLAAAVTPRTAAWAASWADGLITVNQPPEVVREVIEAYRGAGGRGPANLQVHVAWAPTDEEALRLAHEQWAPVVVGSPVAWDLALPSDFESVASFVRPDDVASGVVATSDHHRLADELAALASLGFDEVYVHHVGQEQEAFLDLAATRLLPALAGA